MTRKTLEENIKEAVIYGSNIVFPITPLHIGNPISGTIYGFFRLAEKLGKVNFNSAKDTRFGMLIVRSLGALYFGGQAISQISVGLSHRSPNLLLEGVMSSAMTYELGKEVYQQI